MNPNEPKEPMSESQELRKAMQQCDHCEGKPMTPENQRDEEVKKAKENLYRKLTELRLDNPKFGEPLEELVDATLTAQRQSWEQEKKDLSVQVDTANKFWLDVVRILGITQTTVIENGHGPIEALEHLVKEKAGLEERVKYLEKFLPTAADFEDQEAKLTRLKSRNEELEAEKSKLEERFKFLERGLSGAEYLWQEKINRLTSALGAAMEIIRKILKQCSLVPVDHACIKCIPAGSSVVEGFLCGVHEGVKALSDPYGSVAFERWKKMEAVVEAARYLVKELEAPHQSIAHLVDTDDNAGQYLREALEALDAKGGVSE